MRLAWILGACVLVAASAAGLHARFASGPTGPFPGAALPGRPAEAGAAPDWSRLRVPEAVEVQVGGPGRAPRSVLACLILHEGDAYLSVTLAPVKRWHHAALDAGHVTLRDGTTLFRFGVRRVEDPALHEALRRRAYDRYRSYEFADGWAGRLLIFLQLVPPAAARASDRDARDLQSAASRFPQRARPTHARIPMPALPNLLERAAFFAAHVAPAPMLDYLGAQSLRAAIAALRVGVFRALADRPERDARSLADALSLDEVGLTQLLRALEAAGYVRAKQDRWRLSKSTATWLPLLEEGGEFFHRNVFENWADLETSLRGGRPVPADYADTLDPLRARELLEGLRAFARGNVDALVRALPLPAGPGRVLDLGGGHGLHVAAICRRNPAVRGVVFDQGPALEVARETVAELGVAERVELRAGDFFTDPLGGPYSLVLLFNVLHGYDPERNVALLEHVRSALEPAGALAILDQLEDSRTAGPTARLAARMNGLNLFHARGGRAYRSDEISAWLARAGLRLRKRTDLLRSPGSSLLVAERSAAG